MTFKTIAAVDHQTAKINLHGTFDFSSEPQFLQCSEAALATPHISDIEINMEGVRSMDNRALDALLTLREKASSHNRTLTLVGCRRSVLHLLEAANLESSSTTNT